MTSAERKEKKTNREKDWKCVVMAFGSEQTKREEILTVTLFALFPKHQTKTKGPLLYQKLTEDASRVSGNDGISKVKAGPILLCNGSQLTVSSIWQRSLTKGRGWAKLISIFNIIFSTEYWILPPWATAAQVRTNRNICENSHKLWCQNQELKFWSSF